jgi:formylglycine-generating enzyme required for sulfatase activity/energy-coupling factor transporter ATP-binding protein EcfA2
MGSNEALAKPESAGTAQLRVLLESLEARRRELDAQLRASLVADEDRLGLDETSVIWEEPDIVNGVFVGERPSSPDRQLDILRRALALRTRDLPLRGLELAAGRGLGIARVFVPPATDLTLAEATAERLLAEAAAGAPTRPQSQGSAGPRTPERDRARALTALEALILNPCLAILGDPGSGKSTLLAFIAQALATRNRRLLPGLPPEVWRCIPVLAKLRDFAAWAAGEPERGQAEDSPLWGYIRHDLVERNLGFALDALKGAAAEGRVMLLLDGLDEVPAGALQAVRASLFQWRASAPDCRILVTSRPLPYRRPDWRLPESDFQMAMLRPFDRERIDRFVRDWFFELSARGGLRVADAESRAKALEEEIARDHLGHLSSNPMLLTLMAVVYSQRREIPDARARLYEQALDLMVSRMDVPQPGQPRLGDLLREARRDRCDLIRLLERLAFEAQLGGEGCGEGGGAVAAGTGGGLAESRLVEAMVGLHPGQDTDWAQSAVERIKLDSGLLREEQPGVFYFAHRCIREYLAGCHLAHLPDLSQQAAVLCDGRAYWRECLLHALGYMVHCQREVLRPLGLAERLCPPESPVDDPGWRRIWLAGEAIHEIGLARAGDSEAGAQAVERVRVRLAALVESGRLHLCERAVAASVLTRLVDPRFEPRVLHLPARFRGERETGFGLVAVQPGVLRMGSVAGASAAQPNELGNPQPLALEYPYWISRYPVTVAQFRAFVKARGYERQEYWNRAGWSWCQLEARHSPLDWAHQRLEPNRPVVSLTWLEALAYARWLDEMLRKRKAKLPAGYGLRLPTEAEWEFAARGERGRPYPWGDAPAEGRANVRGSIGEPTPVGLFPQGATPEGVMDLGGNVWEWTLSQDRPYPYRPEDGRNDPDAEGARVVRGGSFDAQASCARGACRARAAMREHAQDIGFRLVLSLAESGV